ncbi:MAG TPA: carboxypeptidase-like regulatory domain-containing protein [Bacteroidales bacterium]|nr:carboxypeptidase-like regulatory domain-containing protein [Bacteroidales bacterium]
MKRAFLLTAIFICNFLILSGQTIKITGHIPEEKGGKKVSGAALYLKPDGKQTFSDDLGNFSFTSARGNKQITARLLGFKSVTIKFNLTSDTVINIPMTISPVELMEVRVTGDSVKSIERTNLGNFIVTPAAIRETPRLFSEPDLLKMLQILPGVSFGKEGTSDFYVRGGGAGQNVIIANGCYFFLPGHLLGIVSSFDLDFLESAELYKDYIPSGIGGGASSVIDLDFRKPHTDSLTAKLRLGLISSGVILEVPFKKINLDLTAGIKRSNYSIYAPLLKKLIPDDVGDFLPPDKYSFFDSFVKLSHESVKAGRISYLFFGNYDNGTDESKTHGTYGDTLSKTADGLKTGWNSMIHALQWEPAVRNQYKWIVNLNYNRLAIGRKIYTESESSVNSTGEKISSSGTLYSFYPAINNIGVSATVSRNLDRISVSLGISDRFRSFVSNNYALINRNDTLTRNSFGGNDLVNETSMFISSTYRAGKKLQIDAGLRLTGILIRNAGFFTAEPRLRISYGQGSPVSPQINYVRLSQNDHAIEGSNAGLRSQLWLPLYKDIGPEISDVLSAGFRGDIKNDLTWSLDGYLKRTSGMLDFKPGASFIFDTSFVDMVERISLRAYGIEAGVIKRTGKVTGSAGYTWSRSKREWPSPEGLIRIPFVADRPHNFNISLKYHYKEKTSLGFNFVYQSGAPATIYMHETSYGEFFETKNNIRYFDYHRLDFSFRRTIHKRRFSMFIDADIYNVYNRKNTFYFKKIWNEEEKRYFYKNISLFPIMPSLTITINI